MTVWEIMTKTGFGPVVAILTMIAALGVYKFVKDWLPW